ncbi:MAG: polysaccharide deacetylase family protein [Bacilli bacterium]|nr:polysaccharide deacetylase family protein [Bacilli bacterium]
MDKMESRNKRKNKLVNFLNISLIILLIVANIYFIKLNINIDKKRNLNINELNSQKNNFNTSETKTKELEKELTHLKNIDEEINEIKNEYFENLKAFEDKVSNKEVDYKIAYLTFDDGPYYLTHKYLEVLEKYNVRATFFTIGLDKESCYDNRSKSCKELYAKTAKYGHTMANHTYSHQIFYGLYSSTNSFINNVKKQEKLIKDRTGITTNIVRFPGGIASAGSLRNSIVKELKNLGYGWVDWTASNGDGGFVASKQDAMNNLKKTINEDIEVILFHDYSNITLSILPDVIEYLQNKNYVLLPLFYESKMINK